MSGEKQIKREIFCLDKQIEQLESKRARSEAYIIDALISGKEPDNDDIRFFRSYTAEIEAKRERILELQSELDTLF